MNEVYTIMVVGLALLAIIKVTLDNIKYRQKLRFDKLARKARLARNAQEERLADIERQLVMCEAISNGYKSAELLGIGFEKVSENRYSSPIVEVLENGSSDTISVKRYYVSVKMQDDKIKSCTKQYL